MKNICHILIKRATTHPSALGPTDTKITWDFMRDCRRNTFVTVYDHGWS